MSEQHVHEIICPMVESERDMLRERIKVAESHVLWLRRRLLHSSPDLPTDEYDGNAWWKAEQADNVSRSGSGAPKETTGRAQRLLPTRPAPSPRFRRFGWRLWIRAFNRWWGFP